MLTMLTMYLLSPTNTLRYLQEIWLGPGVDELLHLLIASTNSATENGGHSTYWCDETLSKRWILISLSWAVL